MPGPNDRSEYQQFPFQGSPDNEHEFLTPKGYRLMRDRKRIVSSVPVAFPEYPPINSIPNQIHFDQFGQPIPIGQPFPTESISGQSIPGQPISGEVYPINEYGQPIEYNQSYDEFGRPIQIIEGYSSPPFSVEPQAIGPPPLQNILPAAKFPDPHVLANEPLTDHYETRRVKNPQKGQLKAIGKLLIQVGDDPSSEPATGSAWIAGPSLIITSAHNLYEFSTGRWSREIEFHPGFDYYSQKELPKCRVVSCCIPKGYMENPATNHDIAACFVDINIGDIVGAEIPMRPVKENDFFNKTPVSIVGYPAGSGFDFGKQMWQSKGEYLFGRSGGPGDDYSPVMATNFGGGASGCPWLVRDDKTDKLVSVGVTSAHAKLRYEKGEPNLMSLISPYFGPKLFDSLSHDHVFHEFGAEDAPPKARRKKKKKKA